MKVACPYGLNNLVICTVLARSAHKVMTPVADESDWWLPPGVQPLVALSQASNVLVNTAHKLMTPVADESDWWLLPGVQPSVALSQASMSLPSLPTN